MEAKEKKPNKIKTLDEKIITLQGMIALSLIFIFGIILTISLFLFSSTEVIGIAGIFASWITAVVAFFFVERGARESVINVTRGIDERIQATEIKANASFVELTSQADELMRGFDEALMQKVDEFNEQIKRSETRKKAISEPRGRID